MNPWQSRAILALILGTTSVGCSGETGNPGDGTPTDSNATSTSTGTTGIATTSGTSGTGAEEIVAPGECPTSVPSGGCFTINDCEYAAASCTCFGGQWECDEIVMESDNGGFGFGSGNGSGNQQGAGQGDMANMTGGAGAPGMDQGDAGIAETLDAGVVPDETSADASTDPPDELGGAGGTAGMGGAGGTAGAAGGGTGGAIDGSDDGGAAAGGQAAGGAGGAGGQSAGGADTSAGAGAM